MVGECIVNTATVDIKVFTEILHTDAGTFDMPAGISDTPGAVPLELLIVKLRLGKPEYKVCLVALVTVLFNTFTHADFKVFFLKIVENVILRKL